jgi:hypothetical protein
MVGGSLVVPVKDSTVLISVVGVVEMSLLSGVLTGADAVVGVPSITSTTNVVVMPSRVAVIVYEPSGTSAPTLIWI